MTTVVVYRVCGYVVAFQPMLAGGVCALCRISRSRDGCMASVYWRSRPSAEHLFNVLLAVLRRRLEVMQPLAEGLDLGLHVLHLRA